MRNVLTVAEREIKAYFASPVAYVVIAAFLVVTGYFFSLIMLGYRQATMRPVFDNVGIILLLLSPVLTMRLLSEEQRSGTIELLLTAPVRDIEVVLGKFLASLGFFLVMVGATAYYPLLLWKLGNPESGPIIAGYVGLILFGATFLSVGLLASSVTQNQIVAAVLAFVALLILWMLDASTSLFSGSAASGVLRYVSLSQHSSDFGKGVIDTKDVVYYLSLVAACLFLTTRALEARRWR
ncbi:MAG: ABC transporter permease subunit [Chloroflexi bacterium]|nr:ABC transporter permease subunit [Chloroflexota bacterium]